MVAILLFALCGLLIVHLEEMQMRETAAVARVIDGDSLDLDGERIRLWGIDAFETGQQCDRPAGAFDCGAAARAHLATLVSGASVICRGRTLDRYRRFLAVCEAAGRDLNAAMVSSGWAVAHGGYEAEERAARAGRIGAWAGNFALPADWRAGRGNPVEPRHDGLGEWLQGIVRRVIANAG